MREDRFSAVGTVAGGRKAIVPQVTWERRRLYLRVVC